MDEHPLLLERRGSVATITLNRPDAGNAINMPLAHALLDAATKVADDPSVRCVVLTGAGRMFCVGGDITMFGSGVDAVPARINELATTLNAGVVKFASMGKPLLVLVNGPAAGAGFSLALAGDLVFAAQSAHFTAAYTAIGLTPDGGMTWLLPRAVGLRRAQEIIYTNRRVASAEAEGLGLITRTIADDLLVDEGFRAAAGLASAATAALGTVRHLLSESHTSGLEEQLNREAAAITSAAGGPEGLEGIAAFVGKRKPSFARD